MTQQLNHHRTGTREAWLAARAELAKLEAAQAERNDEVVKKRRELPWVPVEKEYQFDTEDGKKTLAELFDGRSQLLAYNIMFGPDYTLGACPGCTSLADGLDGSLIHLNHSDVTLLCFSRAPIERLTQGRPARDARLDRLCTRGRDRLPHLHGDGARPIRRALLQLPARANAESPTRRAPFLAEGRVPGMTPVGPYSSRSASWRKASGTERRASRATEAWPTWARPATEVVKAFIRRFARAEQ
jgi:hypothetical protein